MKILLIGATGKVGGAVLAEATSRGHSVVAAARRPDAVAVGSLVAAVKLDANDAAAIAELAADVDVVVSAVSPRSTGNPAEEALGVGRALVAAAEKTGKRLIVVGGAGSLKLPDGRYVAEVVPEAYRNEALAMREVLFLLQKSKINWTFFSPAGQFGPGERTTHYRVGTTTLLTDANGESKISHEDYAHALVNELEAPKFELAQFTVAY